MWKVLLVEDNSVTRSLLLEVLKNRAECRVATNGNDALKEYTASIDAKEPFDIILLDVMMPEVNGIDALNMIRMRENIDSKSGYTPVIILTAYTVLIESQIMSHYDAFIEKPIDSDELIKKMEELIDAK